MTVNKTDSPYLKLHKLFRLVQQGNRFIGYDLGTELGISESFIMLEVDSAPGQSARDLTESLGLDKSTISRHLKSLGQRGLIKATKSKKDSRLHLLEISKAGHNFLKHYDKLSNDLLKQRFQHLNANEQNEVADFFHQLADSYGTSRGAQRSKEHPVRSGMRRLTRSFEILKPSFMGSDLNTTQWQILSEILYSPDKDTVKALSHHFGTAANTISFTLRELERRGYLSRATDLEDKRKQRFTVTAAGEKVITQIEQTASNGLKTALKGSSSKKMINYVRLLEKFAGIVAEEIFGSNMQLTALTSPALRSAGRTFLVESLVKRDWHHLLNETIFSKDSSCFALFEKNKIVAAAEFRWQDGKMVLLHFASEVSPRNSVINWRFLEQCLEKTYGETGEELFLIPANSPAPQFLGMKTGKPSGSNKTLPKLWKEQLDLPGHNLRLIEEGWLIPKKAWSKTG